MHSGLSEDDGLGTGSGWEESFLPGSPGEGLLPASDWENLPYAYGRPTVEGLIRAEPADFVVSERLPFEPSGAGEHVFLRVRKTGQNTRWIAKQLAGSFGRPFSAVGYAGLKDRHAIAEQWFSIALPASQTPETLSLKLEGVEILQMRRHCRKLRPGMLDGNDFRIVIRPLAGSSADIEQRLEQVRAHGVPNYFGPQRFGRAGGNLALLADRPAAGRRLGREARSFGISALRAALFNGYLAERVRDGSWCHPLPGEMLYASETRSHRRAVAGHSTTAPGELPPDPSGLLWGRGQNLADLEALARESRYFARFPRATACLEAWDARMSRRPLRIRPRNLEYECANGVLGLRFGLDRGAYATAVLRELVHCLDATTRRKTSAGVS